MFWRTHLQLFAQWFSEKVTRKYLYFLKNMPINVSSHSGLDKELTLFTHLATERSMRLFLHKLCSIANVCKVFKLDKQLIWIGYTNIIALTLSLVQLYLYNQFIFVVYPIHIIQIHSKYEIGSYNLLSLHQQFSYQQVKFHKFKIHVKILCKALTLYFSGTFCERRVRGVFLTHLGFRSWNHYVQISVLVVHIWDV